MSALTGDWVISFQGGVLTSGSSLAVHQATLPLWRCWPIAVFHVRRCKCRASPGSRYTEVIVNGQVATLGGVRLDAIATTVIMMLWVMVLVPLAPGHTAVATRSLLSSSGLSAHGRRGKASDD